MSEQTDHLRDLLRSKGLRLTSQRRLILDVLEQSETHLHAEAIHDRVKARDPDISLATVYRTLKVLKEVGIVQERILDRQGQKHQYEMAAKTHHHFTCLECGKVIEFESSLIEQESDDLAKRLDLDVVNMRVHLDGYCPDCKQVASTADQGL